MKRERLEDFLENALHSQRFARYIGERCAPARSRTLPRSSGWTGTRSSGWRKQYMREQLERSGKPRPKVIGIDEISVRKGHEYRIVVSDLEKHRPIWFGGADRSEASMDEFYRFLGGETCPNGALGVMDMWKPFRNSTAKHARKQPSCSTSFISCGT